MYNVINNKCTLKIYSIRLPESIVDSNMQDRQIQRKHQIPLQEKEEEHQQQRDRHRRSLLRVSSLLDDVIFCIPNGTITATTDDNIDTTNSTSSDMVEWSTYVTATIPYFLVTYYTLRGGKEGNCIDNCQSICNHQPCYHDMLNIRNTECYCLRHVSSNNNNDNTNDQYQCGDNAGCSSSISGNNDICHCMPGYIGNPYMGCTKGSTPSSITDTTSSNKTTTSAATYLKQSTFYYYCIQF